jgi:hypothetical protein
LFVLLIFSWAIARLLPGGVLGGSYGTLTGSVRPASHDDRGQRLQRIGRTARDPVKLRRAIVVLMSAQGQAVPDIAYLLDCSQKCVRGVTHAFNDIGLRALNPKWSGDRPKTISEPARGQPGNHAADPARGRGQLAGRQDLEGPSQPGLHRQDAPRAGPVRSSARRRPGGLRR